MILEPKKRKSVTASTFSPSICCEVMGPDCYHFYMGPALSGCISGPPRSLSPRPCPPRFLSPQISVPHIPVHCSLAPSSSPMCPRAMLSMVFDHLCPVLWDKQMKAAESGSKLAVHQQEMPSPRPAPMTQVPHSALKGMGHPPH